MKLKIPSTLYQIGQIFLGTIILLIIFGSFNEKIVIEGRINALKTYSIGVNYKAQKGGFFCSNWSMWNGISRKNKYYKYYPDIHNSEHHIKVPTHKFFFSFCDYKLEQIEMNIREDKIVLFKNNGGLSYVNPPYNKQIKFVKSEQNNYTLDIGPINHNRVNSIWSERKKYTVTPKQIEQKRLVKIARKQLNQLAIPFNEFSSQHLRFPSYNEAKEIFSLHQDLLIDPWGKHYKYEISKNHYKTRLIGHVPPIIVNQNTKYKAQGSYIQVPLSFD